MLYEVITITRVGQRIASAAERWLDANGYKGYLKDYNVITSYSIHYTKLYELAIFYPIFKSYNHFNLFKVIDLWI